MRLGLVFARRHARGAHQQLPGQQLRPRGPAPGVEGGGAVRAALHGRALAAATAQRARVQRAAQAAAAGRGPGQRVRLHAGRVVEPGVEGRGEGKREGLRWQWNERHA